MGYESCHSCDCVMNRDHTYNCHFCDGWYCDACQSEHEECTTFDGKNMFKGWFFNWTFFDHLDRFDIEELERFLPFIKKHVKKLENKYYKRFNVDDDEQDEAITNSQYKYKKQELQEDCKHVVYQLKLKHEEKKNEAKVRQEMAEEMANKYNIPVQTALQIIKDLN